MTTIKQKIGKLIFKLIPLTTENLNRIRFEFRLFRIDINNFINPFRILIIYKLKSQKNIKLNIGAGPFGEENWINIDTYPLKNINLIYNCRKRLPFNEDSVNIIRCEHVFEHLDLNDESPCFLKECKRVLIKNGILRIVVPDINKFILAYISNQWNDIGMDLNKFLTPADILNHVFRQNGEHKYGYDFETLKLILKKHGFRNVSKLEWGISSSPLLKNDLENHKLYSLYVECAK